MFFVNATLLWILIFCAPGTTWLVMLDYRYQSKSFSVLEILKDELIEKLIIGTSFSIGIIPTFMLAMNMWLGIPITLANAINIAGLVIVAGVFGFFYPPIKKVFRG